MNTPAPSNRFSPALYFLLGGAVVFFVIGYMRTNSEVAALRQERERLNAELQQTRTRLDRVDAKLTALESQARQARSGRPADATGAAPPRQLSTRVLRPAMVQPSPVDTVKVAPRIMRRSWGPEQATGAPDTMAAGDQATAWAPLQQDAGAEWLRLEFAKAVEVAEVRIRETFNPGAIQKVVAVDDGVERPLWEGVEEIRPAPCEFVVPTKGGISARSIVVHLDTARVPGWNEIDAVELVGKDGSRQWAQSATASSSFAEAMPPSLENVAPVLPIPTPTAPQ